MAELEAFVTPGQLASTMGVDMPSGLILGRWVDALDDASGYLRSEIGQPITAGTVTLALTTDHRGEADIWLCPVTAITTVLDDKAETVDSSKYRLDGQRLWLPRPCSEYTVTLAYGYSDIPREIQRWTKVLAAAQIAAAASGHLGITPVTSVGVDDGKVTYSDAMQVALPDAQAAKLKATYGGMQ